MVQDDYETLVYDGIRFLESLTRYYGAEKGMEVWEKLGEAVGQEVKGAVFFKMLTGETGTRLTVREGTCTQAVAAIKAIRNATGCGLKEAKDMWDMSKMGAVKIDVGDTQKCRQLAGELRGLGMQIG